MDLRILAIPHKVDESNLGTDKGDVATVTVKIDCKSLALNRVNRIGIIECGSAEAKLWYHKGEGKQHQAEIVHTFTHTFLIHIFVSNEAQKVLIRLRIRSVSRILPPVWANDYKTWFNVNIYHIAISVILVSKSTSHLP